MTCSEFILENTLKYIPLNVKDLLCMNSFLISLFKSKTSIKFTLSNLKETP